MKINTIPTVQVQAPAATPVKFWEVVGVGWNNERKGKKFVAIKFGNQKSKLQNITLEPGDTLFLRPSPFPKRTDRDADWQLCVDAV